MKTICITTEVIVRTPKSILAQVPEVGEVLRIVKVKDQSGDTWYEGDLLICSKKSDSYINLDVWCSKRKEQVMYSESYPLVFFSRFEFESLGFVPGIYDLVNKKL